MLSLSLIPVTVFMALIFWIYYAKHEKWLKNNSYKAYNLHKKRMANQKKLESQGTSLNLNDLLPPQSRNSSSKTA